MHDNFTNTALAMSVPIPFVFVSRAKKIACVICVYKSWQDFFNI